MKKVKMEKIKKEKEKKFNKEELKQKVLNVLKSIMNLLKKIKLRHLIALVALLMFNTYAWFLYATEVSTSLTAHVTSWNVEFTNEDGESISNIVIDVSQIYPGMEDYERTIIVHNRGESNASLSYEIQSVEILGDTYELGDAYTSDDLENLLNNNYPFKITIEKSEGELESGTGDGSFTIRITWPYESGDDELDTYWGKRAYEYYQQNPDGKSVYIKMKLEATQHNN